METLEELIQILKANKEPLLPLHKSELKKIEAKFGSDLPRTYLDFLVYMGNGAGRFMRGSSVFYDSIFDLKEASEDLVKENKMEPLPENAFVFWMHQGYQMAYFKIKEGDNPDVYYFLEGSKQRQFTQEGSLLDFFEAQLIMSGITTI